jgi:rsbT co-antagonist protein RsbR
MKESLLSTTLINHQTAVLDDWNQKLESISQRSGGKVSKAELEGQARRFLDLVSTASAEDGDGPQTAELKAFLEDLSKSRASQGFTAEDTALLIFSLKAPVLRAMRTECNDDIGRFAEGALEASERFDSLGLFTVNAFQRSREDLIARQQDELLELSTPVVKLWDGILALPLIGTLDSARTQVVMESLLQRIVETGSAYAIIDITGVPMVDTMVAQHLLKTVTAIRLMGADCIISGIRPQIAQTIVHLGVELGDVITKATLADALSLAMRKSGAVVEKAN